MRKRIADETNMILLAVRKRDDTWYSIVSSTTSNEDLNMRKKKETIANCEWYSTVNYSPNHRNA